MFRDLLSSRWFQGGFAFFVLCVSGSLLYSWHVHRTTEAEFGKRPQPVVSIENKSSTNTAPVDIQTEGVTNTLDENTDTPISESTEAFPNETEFADIADAFLPDDFVLEEEAPAEDVPVSPYGFGPYPEVPEDFPFPVDWTDRTEQQELLMRVMIKAWTEGERFIGGNIVDGKVRLNYSNTVYVRHKEIQTADGVITSRAIAGATDVQVPPPGEDFPPHVRVLDFDSAGIDPYEYLDLSQKEIK